MKLNNDNYFSPEANMTYMSATQFKDFLNCEAAALARVKGEYADEYTTPLLVGSYVDAHFSGEIEKFTAEHPEIFNKRTGELKADYRKADKIIERAERDPVFREALSGDNQKIMTGELYGVPFKIKMDSYFEGERIVDLKVLKDMKNTYKNGEWKPFVDAWGYDIQGFIYQQIVKANTGKELPFYLAVITKEDPADMELIHIPQWKLNSTAAVIEHYVERFAAIKRGEIEPDRCGNCNYCRETKVLTGAIEYDELLETDF